LLKFLPLIEVLQLIQEFSKTKETHLQILNYEIALFCASHLLSYYISKPKYTEGIAELALEWTSLHQQLGTTSETLCQLTLGLASNASRSHQMYALCNILHVHPEVNINIHSALTKFKYENMITMESL
jgi:hypothetical protein